MKNKPVVPDSESQLGKKEQVEKMFDNIAPKYDFLNRLLSLGIDKWWRYVAINKLKPVQPKTILDVATGTADLALASLRLKPEKVIGIDISEQMLAIGKEKVKACKQENIITLQQADAENLPFEDNSFDAITVAFGVRNFANLPLGLANMWRVLKPGGSLVILELTQPPNKLMRLGYNAYNRYWLPFIGKMLSKNNSAYTYLPASIRAFPQGNDFINHLKNAQFTHTRFIRLTFGICTIYFGKKPI